MYKSIEYLIESVSPGWARRRAISRGQCGLLRGTLARTAAYEAGDKGRVREGWMPKKLTADGASFETIDLIIARSRYLSRNTPWGKSVINAYGRNVVGCGIKPTPAVVNDDGTPNETFNDTAAQIFNDWAGDHRQCDVERRITFWAMQKQAVQQIIEAGEVFYRPVMMKANRFTGPRDSPVALQRLEVEQLNINLFKHEKNEVRRGIEVDEFMAAVAYHFMNKPEGDAGIMSPTTTVRFDASNMLHLFIQERSGQTHGVPAMAPIINRFRDLSEMDSWELYAAKVQSSFALIINTKDGNDNILLGKEGDDLEDDRGNMEDIMEPGLIWHGEKGEDVKPFATNRPNNNYAEFIRQQQHSAAAGVDLSFEVMTRDYTGGTYSSQRQSLLEDIRAFKCYQAFMISSFCNPIYRKVIEVAVLQGKLKADDFHSNPKKWLAVKWVPPGWAWIDPLKEAQGAEISLENNLTSLQDITAAQGKDYKEVLRQLKVEQDFKDELGLRDSKPEAPRDVVEETNIEAAPSKRRKRKAAKT